MITHLTIQAVLPWVMSFFTIVTMWLAGEKKHSAWVIGLLNQCLWAIYIVITKQWGLSPLVIIITVIYTWNLVKWNKNV